MNLRDFAQTVVDDPGYRDSVLRRAREGTLDPTIEMLLLELAESRTVNPDRTPAQSRTLALVTPSDIKVPQ